MVALSLTQKILWSMKKENDFAPARKSYLVMLRYLVVLEMKMTNQVRQVQKNCMYVPRTVGVKYVSTIHMTVIGLLDQYKMRIHVCSTHKVL